MTGVLSTERLEELRKSNIRYIMNDDVQKMILENKVLKIQSVRKLFAIMILSLVYSLLMILMSFDALIPRVGDIGAYKPDGEVVLLTPQINPPVRMAHAYNYGVDVVQTIRTYRFLSYIDSIFESEKYFSEEGFEQYLIDLDSSGHIQRILTNKENRLSIVSSEQKIWAVRRIEGSDAFWYMKVKLLTRIEKLDGSDELLNESVNIKLKEVPRNISRDGLLIEYIRE